MSITYNLMNEEPYLSLYKRKSRIHTYNIFLLIITCILSLVMFTIVSMAVMDIIYYYVDNNYDIFTSLRLWFLSNAIISVPHLLLLIGCWRGFVYNQNRINKLNDTIANTLWDERDKTISEHEMLVNNFKQRYTSMLDTTMDDINNLDISRKEKLYLMKYLENHMNDYDLLSKLK